MIASLVLHALLAQATPQATPTGPVYFGAPAARMTLDARPLGFDADGNARWLVVAKFFDAGGRVTRIMANSDLDWRSRGNYVQWQTRLRYGQPSAIVKTKRNGPLKIVVHANVPSLGTVTAQTDTRRWHGTRVVAAALGPHTAQVGWFPEVRGRVRVERIDAHGRRTLAVIAGCSSSYRDDSVRPGTRYRYVVVRNGVAPVMTAPIFTPGPPPGTSVRNASGKAMWLFFTANPLDPIYYERLDPAAIVDQSVRAGLHYVELRVAYGAYWEITPEAKPAIDAIVDRLALHGIGTIAWTVPRDTTFEDLRTSVRAAYYRTSRGTPFTGLALDLERGPEFMGGDPGGVRALSTYVKRVREAIGPGYLLMSTVEDPYLEHLNNRMYPYPEIARYSSVLQPMAYWRMMRRRPTTAEDVPILLGASFARILALAQRRRPISIGGQTDAEGPNGYPPAAEIAASLQTARSLGAIGECFFAWDGTQPYQWDAISAFRWQP